MSFNGLIFNLVVAQKTHRWTELAVSFMLWAARTLPVTWKIPGVQLQPLKAKSVRALSETFRLIVKHMNTIFSIQIHACISQTRFI